MAKRTNEKKDNTRTAKGANRSSSRKDHSYRRDYDRDDRVSNSNNRACNDASWYANSDQLLKDTASLAYSHPLGVPFNLDVTSPDYYKHPFETGVVDSNIPTSEDVPGIMSLLVDISVGVSNSNSSPINIAARNLYSFVRHANSGHSNYEAPDLMLYVLAMDSLYAAYAYMARAYGTMALYSQTNRYYPKVLFEAMGLDFDDFQANIADFRAYINTVAYKLGVMCVPASMTYMTRHQWMFTNYFVDSPAKKSQTYLYTPHHLWKYSGYSNETGGELVAEQFFYPHRKLTFSELRAKIDAMLASVIEDEDMNIMSGDILKAFGADKVTKISTIDENFAVLPAYNVEVLSQIQNATVLPPLNDDSLKITQEAGRGIVFNPQVAGTGYMGDRVLSMYKDDVTPSDTMVATRCTVFIQSEQEPDHEYSVLDSTGSEIITGAIIYTTRVINDDVTIDKLNFSYVVPVQIYLGEEDSAISLYGSIAYVMRMVAQINAFNMHPVYRLGTEYPDSNGYHVCVPVSTVFDAENFTIVKSETIANMHQTALLSEFAVPAMGAWNSKTK